MKRGRSVVRHMLVGGRPLQVWSAGGVPKAWAGGRVRRMPAKTNCAASIELQVHGGALCGSKLVQRYATALADGTSVVAY